MKKYFAPVCLCMSLMSAQVSAVSFGVFDPRSHAMGGVGVAAGDASNATHYNPALLSVTRKEDDFSLVIPTVRAGYEDPDELADKLDEYDNANYEANLDAAISNFNAAATPAGYIGAAGDVATASQDLLTAIQGFDDNRLIVNANAGVLVAVPSSKLGVSVSANGRTIGGGQIDVTDADIALMSAYVSVLSCIGSLNPGTAVIGDVLACDNPTYDLINDATGQFNNTITNDQLTSAINARGALISEISVSLAHQFASLGNISIGITPKSLDVDTYDYSVNLETADIEADQGEVSYSDVNLDVGVVIPLGDRLKLGVVGKNIIARDYATALGNTIKIEPQYRAGLAYQNSWALIGIDVDLTENKGLGFDYDSQFISAGIEFDLFDFLQARAGYRHNLSDTPNIDSGLPSLGLGISPFGVHLDISVAANDDIQEAALQLGIKF